MPKIALIVPCRLESTRFPRKLLHKIKGKSLLLWVAERIAREAPELPLYFAVDDELLRECVTASGFKAIMTRVDHASGTDRIEEANRSIGAEHVINVQADEPLVSARQIKALVELIAGPADMATLATPFTTAADFANPNQVKVVLAPAARRTQSAERRFLQPDPPQPPDGRSQPVGTPAPKRPATDSTRAARPAQPQWTCSRVLCGTL
jgi:3-deoxy-manno-octulosonate cytidylyltransferase (CMP-KDO synthetase)